MGNKLMKSTPWFGTWCIHYLCYIAVTKHQGHTAMSVYCSYVWDYWISADWSWVSVPMYLGISWLSNGLRWLVFAPYVSRCPAVTAGAPESMPQSMLASCLLTKVCHSGLRQKSRCRAGPPPCSPHPQHRLAVQITWQRTWAWGGVENWGPNITVHHMGFRIFIDNVLFQFVSTVCIFSSL